MVTMSSASGTPSIQDLLAGVSFPVTKADLLEHMRMNGAAGWMLDAVQNSAAARFSGPQEVMDTVRGS